jgi:ADP-heptose:LPS heptosyltransferase
MGLFSRHGINKANALKKINKFSHLEIFSKIFKCIDVLPNYKGVVRENKIIEKNNIVVGFNPFAGSRWPNKSLKNRTIRSIIKNLITNKRIKKINCFGFNMQNKEKLYSNHKVNILKTKTIDSFFYAICQCDYIITADSLGVHLAAAAQVPYVCFFGPTSAEEVKTPCTPFINIKSSPPGYCSYKPTQKILGLYSKKITSALHTLIKKCSSKKH